MPSTIEEKAAALDTYVSYCGRYEVGDDQVYHHPELSSLPNFTGREEARFYTLEGDRLTIYTHPFLQAGRTRSSHVIWRRA